jgi:RNA polymerase sigma factor (sigma-70 family)
MFLQMQPQEENPRVQLLHHLDAAYNLAHWLTRDNHDAEDIVQEAYMRAYKRFSTFTGVNGRAWLLTIVRNCSYDLLRRNGTRSRDDAFDEEVHIMSTTTACNPEAALLREERAELVRNALTDLPPEHREILILREMEELSYSEIAGIMGVPLGTVMSRLSRARDRLRQNLAAQADAERTYFKQTSSPIGPARVI